MTTPLTVYIAPDITASFCAPLPAGDTAPWHAPTARITCAADWLAFRGGDTERLAPVRILAAHRLGLRGPGGMEVVAEAARECAARGHREPWSLVVTAASWERLQRLARLQGSPWPPARVEPLATAGHADPIPLAEVLAVHDHAGEAETLVRLALSELLAHGELATGELADVLRTPPDDLELTLESLQVQGLAERQDGYWRIADAAHGAVAAWLARIHLPT